jgi:uncharacterized protein YkwD
MQNPLRLRPALGALAALAIVACSDASTGPDSQLTPAAALAAKGGKTTKPSPSPTPTPTPTPTTGTTYSVTTCDGGTIALSADEKASLDLHNQTRASYGLPAFCVDQTLTTAACAHSAEMLAYGYFSHNSYNGETFDQRLTRMGYTGWTNLAENVAYGSGSYGSASAIFDSWMNSSGHRANILNGGLLQIGIGAQVGTYQGYSGVGMWTADFGTR